MVCHKVFGLIVPPTGIQSNYEGIKISTDSLRGPVLPTRIILPKIGALKWSSVNFNRPLAGSATRITVQLTPFMQIERGSTIRVFFPEYRRGESANIVGCTFVGSCFWDENAKSVTVLSAQSVAELGTLTFSIPMTAGIRLPVKGVQSNLLIHTISLESSYGNVNPIEIDFVQNVGSFSDTKLAFNPKPPMVRREIEMSIQFAYVTEFEEGDTIMLILPGFYQSDEPGSPPEEINLDNNIWTRGRWFREKNWLVLTSSKNVEAGYIQDITIPRRFGLFPPLLGSPANNNQLKIVTEVRQGPVLPTAFEKSDMIGSLGAKLGLEFSTKEASQATDLIFSFENGMELRQGDTIEIFLKKFTLTSKEWTGLATNEASYAGSEEFSFDTTVKYSEEVQGLNITLKPLSDVPLRTTLKIKIPSVSGILIPVNGVQANDDAHKVKANVSVDGSALIVPERPFDEVPAVGAVLRSEIYFDPPKVKTAVQITLVLQTYMAILKNEIVRLKLPGLLARSPISNSNVNSVIIGTATSEPSTYLKSKTGEYNCKWVSSVSVLELTVSEDLPALQVVTIQFPLDWKLPATGQNLISTRTFFLQLPDAGIETNDNSLKITIDARDGPVSETAFKSVRGVMAFSAGGPDLTFLPLPFAPSELAFSLRFTRKLQKGDSVAIILPGFTTCSCIDDAYSTDPQETCPATSRDITWFSKCNCGKIPGRVQVLSNTFEDHAIWHEGHSGYLSADEARGEICVSCGATGSCYTSHLTFTVKNDTVAPNTPIFLTIPEANLRLPVDGISAARNPIMLQLKAVAGDLAPFPVSIKKPFSSLITNESLRLGVPIAGSISSISFSFQLNAPAPKGSNLSLHLPSFFRDERLTFSKGFGTVEILCNEATRSVLDYGGLCDNSIEICCDPSPLDHASRIVEWYGPVELSSEVTLMDGTKKDALKDAFGAGEWDPIGKKILLTLTKDLPERCAPFDGALRIRVTIPNMAGIRVPVSGLSDVKLSSSFHLNLAGATPTMPAILFDIPTVQPLFHSSKISFTRTNSLGTGVGINIEFIMTASLLGTDFAAGAPAKDDIRSFVDSSSNENGLEENMNVRNMRPRRSDAGPFVTAQSGTGYTISVLLPGFFNKTNSASGPMEENVEVCFDATCELSSTRKAKVAWNQVEGRLILTQLVPPKKKSSDTSNVVIRVRREAGLNRPPQGVDEKTGLMLSIRINDRRTKSLLELRKSFDAQENIVAITSVSLDFVPRIAGKPTSISLKFALSFDLASGDTVSLELPGFTGSQNSFTIYSISSTFTCSIQRQIGLIGSNDLNCGEITYDLSGNQMCKQGGFCKPNWYGPTCESYCDDLKTCNAHRGMGFCNLFGTCTCFPPNKGRFCNSTEEIMAMEDCGPLAPLAFILPHGPISFAGSWSQSSSTLTLTVLAAKNVTIAAGSRVNITMRTDGSRGAGISLPASGLTSSAGKIALHVSRSNILCHSRGCDKNSTQEKVTSSIIDTYPEVIKFRCLFELVKVTGGSLCDGVHTVRVCARSQDDVAVYAKNIVEPLLKKVDTRTCLADTCGVDGAKIEPSKESCCMVHAVADFGTCGTDADCLDLDTRTYEEEKGVPWVNETCCDFCDKTLSKWCKTPVNACRTGVCSKNTPCWGHQLTRDTMDINNSGGGSLELASGSGVFVPPGVWPLELDKPLELSVYTEPFAVDDVAGAVTLSEALYFEPSGTIFREPGVTLSFRINPELAIPPVGFRIAVFKIVGGVPIEHRFRPEVDEESGLVSVKTLSFSAYVVMQVPEEKAAIVKTARPVISIAPTVPSDAVYRPEDKSIASVSGMDNPKGPLFIGVVCACVLLLVCASIYAYKKFNKVYRLPVKKGVLLLEDSYRMQEEMEPAAEDIFAVGTDLVTTDGDDISPPSSRLDQGDIERILSLGEEFQEIEPPAQGRLPPPPGMAAYGLKDVFGSVGLIGTGKRLTRAARPSATEVQSTVHLSSLHGAPIEMTADLVLLDTMDALDDGALEEEEPNMEPVSLMPNVASESSCSRQDHKNSFSATGSRWGLDKETPVDVLRSDMSNMQLKANVDSVADLNIPFGSEDQEEEEPRAEDLSIPFDAQDQEENEPRAEQIMEGGFSQGHRFAFEGSGFEESEPGAEEIHRTT